ncbi:MAG: YdcH family protein [Betaproteobacteria bacterium]
MTDVPPGEEEKALIRARLQALALEHQDLDDVIKRLSSDPLQDQLQLRRLKKRKLVLKDQISRLRTRLIPDIIA